MSARISLLESGVRPRRSNTIRLPGLPGACRYAVTRDGIEEAPDAVTCLKREVFAAYESWADAEGIRHPMTQKQLSRKLKERGWADHCGKFWRAVRIAEEKPEGEED